MPSFPPYARICEVPVREVFECVLYVMYRWGHIQRFRFDNGRPFGDPKRESLTPCALLLLSYGCGVCLNPPRSPTKNAKVERCQGTTGRWADFRSCEDTEALRTALDYAVTAQRERLPSRACAGRTRAEHYPELFANTRRFDSGDMDTARAFEYLKQGQWYRRVSSNGVMAMFGANIQVGHRNRGRDVTVRFEVREGRPYWVCLDHTNQGIAEIIAKNLEDGSYFDLSKYVKEQDG